MHHKTEFVESYFMHLASCDICKETAVALAKFLLAEYPIARPFVNVKKIEATITGLTPDNVREKINEKGSLWARFKSLANTASR